MSKQPLKNTPDFLFHATPQENANSIATEGLRPHSGEKKYLCMSGTESGATTLHNKATDIIFRVNFTQLNESDWEKKGAGKEEWRSESGIPANILEYRRNLGDKNQTKWRQVSDRSNLPKTI